MQLSGNPGLDPGSGAYRGDVKGQLIGPEPTLTIILSSFPDAFTIVIPVWGCRESTVFRQENILNYPQCSNHFECVLRCRNRGFCLGPKKLVTTRVQSHWIPDLSTRGRRKVRLRPEKTVLLNLRGLWSQFTAMRSEQILQRPKVANSPQPKGCNFQADAVSASF